MRSAVLFVAWGYALPFLGIVLRWPPASLIGLLGPLVVLLGLTCFKGEGAPRGFIDRLWLSGTATAVGWVGSILAVFRRPALVAQILSMLGSAVGLVLVVSAVTRLFVGLAAAEPLRAWRRLTWAALVVAGVSVIGAFVVALLIPVLPGASTSPLVDPRVVPPDGSFTVSGDHMVTGTALVVALVFAAAQTAASLAMVVLAVPALGALKRWAKTEGPEDDDPWTSRLAIPTESRVTKP